MRNLADMIENFIVSELLRDQEDALMVQRNELAERLDCAPSQISYVLSTRFTPERGFMVESRRGSGGYVRIMRIEPEEQLTKLPVASGTILERQVNAKPAKAEEIVARLYQDRMITSRERKLLEFMLDIVDVSEQQKLLILEQAVKRLGAEG